MSNLYIRITRPEGYEDVHPDLILQDMNIDPVWGAEVVDVEVVLRECRDEILARAWGLPYNLDGVVTKIDEVLPKTLG